MWILAFVDICTVSTRAVQLISFVTLATKHAEYVLAPTEYAQIAKHFTFVYIHAHLLVVLVRMHETHFTFASKRSRIIEAVSIFAKCIVIGAFVNVFAGVTIASKSSIADALEQLKILL